MLVLARQLNERIVLPTVPATIEIVAIKPGGVRLGIEAPVEVTVLREEVFRRGGASPAALLARTKPDAESRLGQIKHVLRNRLHTVALGLELLRQQLSLHSAPDSEALLQSMGEDIRSLDRQMRGLLSDPLDELPLCAAAPPKAEAVSAVCLEVGQAFQPDGAPESGWKA